MRVFPISHVKVEKLKKTVKQHSCYKNIRKLLWDKRYVIYTLTEQLTIHIINDLQFIICNLKNLSYSDIFSSVAMKKDNSPFEK